MKLGYIGKDQYGNRFKIDKYPRKELLEQLYATNAAKMYVDKADGSIEHVGYIIKGHWINIYEIHSWK